MSATISATGTWSPLTIDVSSAPVLKTGTNVGHVSQAQLEQLKDGVYSELDQFIQLAATGWGVNYQTAKTMLYALMTHALQTSELPAGATAIVGG
jgi:hypothetical protein